MLITSNLLGVRSLTSLLALLVVAVSTAPAWALDPAPTAVSLTSRHIAVSWTTSSAMFAQIEYSLSPFTSPMPQGSLFPTTALSRTQYTSVSSLTHDLCVPDLRPNTLYFVRVRSASQPGGHPHVSQTATVKTLPAPPAPPTSEFTTSNWIGLYATDQWMSNATIATNLMAAKYAHGATVYDKWANIEPTPGRFDFSTIDWALATLAADGKYVKLNLRSTANPDSQRIPDWVPDGVETIVTSLAGERIVKWDPTFACRWWKFVKAYGNRYDQQVRGRLAFVNVSGVGSGEMATLSRTLDAYGALGYTDSQIDTNLRWAWRNTLEVFAEVFPHARLGVVPGSIPLTRTTDVGSDVVDAAVRAYGARLVLSHSGFSLDKSGFIIQQLLLYRGQVWIGGLTELPPADSMDPAAVLQDLFDGMAVPYTFDFVTLHSDALGINPNRWGDLPALKELVTSTDAWYAQWRSP